jgi:transmembrane protein 132
MIYFDGSETHGASSVGVVVKYGQLSSVIYMRVWIPELPLDVDLSDTKLSQIVGWRIPASSTQMRRR